jgi:hypothetical protein
VAEFEQNEALFGGRPCGKRLENPNEPTKVMNFKHP